MIEQQAKTRLKKLREVINHHRYLEHVLDKQEISASALDSLKKELFDLEEKYPHLITADSPTQRVAGKPLDKFAKIEHSPRMFSLNDGFSEKDMLDWQERISKLLSDNEKKQLDYFVEPKVDGLAVDLLYKQGVLQEGSTRGDGSVGEDVSQNLKTIESIPLKLEKSIDCQVRGEVYIAKKDFQKLNQEQEKKGEAIFANPRNTAAGALRQLDPQIVKARKLSFLAWQMLGQKNQQKEYQELLVLGFKPVDGVYCQNLEAVFQEYVKLQKQREKLPYLIDGVVVSVNNNQIFDKLGFVGKAPRGAIAFKFPLKETETIVLDIKAQVGRTGAITPVAILKPVALGGVVVSRATLHNDDEIKRLGLKIGDTVIIGRAGDVIPQVIKVIKELRNGREKSFVMPKNCPACSTRLIKKLGEVAYRCPNLNCQARLHRQFYHFVSKQAFDIEHLGPKVVDQLLDQGLVNDPADLFLLKEGDLLALERFAEKSASNLINSIEAKKTISLSRFIFALGISDVGQETARLLTEQFLLAIPKARPSVILREGFARPKNLLHFFQGYSQEDLQKIKDIGPVVAQHIYDWFDHKKNIDFLERLDKADVKIIVNNQLSIINDKLKGKSFVLTGTLKSLTRDQAKEKIRGLGGDISESVSKKTDFVVAGDNPGSKLSKAQSLGIKILTESEFLKML